jgi:hypothetical protein
VKDDPGCRVSNTAVAKVQVLGGPKKALLGDFTHLPLWEAKKGAACGWYKILEVSEPGMPTL